MHISKKRKYESNIFVLDDGPQITLGYASMRINGTANLYLGKADNEKNQ